MHPFDHHAAEAPGPVPVRIVSQEPPPPAKVRERAFIPNTYNIPANTPVQILSHAPMRTRATVTIVGQSSDVAYLCKTHGDAQKNSGAICMGLQVLDLRGTGELWIVSATAIAVGVVSEHESS